MKILKIFGVVVAIHAFAFVLIFANPGCSSAGKPSPTATTPTAEPSRPPTIAYNPPAGDAPVLAASPAASSAPIGFDPNAPAISAPTRYSPTRPGTAAATAVQAQPAADVIPATTYAVASGDSLWTIAKKNHLTVAELSKANNLSADAKLHPGQKLMIPAKSAAAASGAATATTDGAPTYKVQSGDKLATIARRAGTTTVVLKQLNNMKTDTVRIGQTLKLPAGATVAESAPADLATAAKPSGDSFTHIVQARETLSTIAKKYEVKASDIAKENNITDPAKIRPGMSLVIPGWKAPKSAKTAAAVAPEDASAPKVLTSDQDATQPSAPPAPMDIPVIKIEGSK
jgi:LysM repeat protein